MRRLALLCCLFLFAAAPPAALAESDRHEGYYYSGKVTTEVYVARSRTLLESDKTKRLQFVTALTNKMLQGPYAPPFIMFAKGAESEKLIIVGMGDYMGTIYQARAVLAMLSALARTTPLFREYKVETIFTFFDLANMMGFEQVTITDGKTFAHQIQFKREP
jgi:hypothetical protein